MLHNLTFYNRETQSIYFILHFRKEKKRKETEKYVSIQPVQPQNAHFLDILVIKRNEMMLKALLSVYII